MFLLFGKAEIAKFFNIVLMYAKSKPRYDAPVAGLSITIINN